MRKGPNPLSVHIGMAATEMARLGQDDPAQHREEFEAMLRGIMRYTQSDLVVDRPDVDEVCSFGEVKLCQLAGQRNGGAVVLLIPSMINRSHILNLSQQRSMMQYFSAQGLHPYLLDWGESKLDAEQANFDTFIAERLIPAIQFCAQKAGDKVHAMAYCMGGTLLVAAAQQAQTDLASLTFLAAPWDFHAGTKALQKRVDFWWPSAMSMMADKDYLDQDWLQTIFASLDPLQTRNKFIRFADMDAGSDAESLFVAIEDWLNDGVDLPRGIAEGCIQDWFFENKPAQQTWSVNGEIVNPGNIKVPSLIVASRRDSLVEFDSAVALKDQLPDTHLVTPDCGHIGMIAGSKAIDEAWQPICEFIASCKAV